MPRIWSREGVRDLVLVWLLSLAVLAITAALFHQPGYMDAYYYYHVAANLAQGKGLVEEFVWNYLPAPPAVSHPSNLYWMPLTSLLAAPFLLPWGATFRAAQVPSVLTTSLLVVVAYSLGRRLFPGRRHALGMAALTLFSGYYFSYWTAVDSFALFALTANLALWCMYRAAARPTSLAWAAGVGFFVALSHLARADGVLLLGVFAVVQAASLGRSPAKPGGIGRLSRPLAVAVVVYGLAMAPWFVRNWFLVGAPLSPAGFQTMLMREYNDFYGYSRDLSLTYYLQWGAANILWSKVEALGRNLLVLFGMEYYLAPLAVLGAWHVRRDPRHWPFLAYALILYLTMALLFTFPAARGSMLHSAAALLPWLSGVALRGLDRVVLAIALRLPHWNVPLACRNLTLILAGFSIALSLILLAQKVAGWDERYQHYEELAGWFAAREPSAVVMVVDPPGYYYSSGRPAVVIPSDGPEAALEVARRYAVAYLALEVVHARPFRALYRGEVEVPGLQRVDTVGTTQIYRLTP